jgi:uncharacterized membrane protein
VLAVIVLARGSAAQTPPLVCYGNEPSWSLELSDTTARFKTLGEGESDFIGGASVIAPLKAQAWRGRPASGPGGDLVAFLAEGACSDGMSDLKRPYSARVSLPDGRFFAGCCRPDTFRAASDPVSAIPLGESVTPPAAAPPKAPSGSPAPAPGSWVDSLQDYLPALRSCTFEAMRTEAVVFAEAKPKSAVHLVLRLSGGRYADCDALNYGPARVVPRAKNAVLSKAEQGPVVTLLPGEPPRGTCFQSEPAMDDKGNPFGWITRKRC